MSRYAWEKIKTLGARPVEWVLDEEKTQENWQRATVDAQGVVRWKSNGRVPFEDALAAFLAIGCKLDLARSNAARNADTAAFLKDYKAQAKRPVSAEERFEAQAAFGRGAKVVDVLSGRKFRT